MRMKPLPLVSTVCLMLGAVCTLQYGSSHLAQAGGRHKADLVTMTGTQDTVAAMARALANADAPDKVVEQTIRVRRGDTLMDVLVNRANVPVNQAQDAIQALRTHYNPRDLKPGQNLAVIFERAAPQSPQKHFVGFHFKPTADTRFRVARLEDGGFKAESFNAPTREETVRGESVIKASLMGAAASAGVPNAITLEAINAFAHEIDFQRDIQPGDRFVAVYDRVVTDEGAVIRNGHLKYAALTVDGVKKEIFRFTRKNGDTGFYDADGKSVKRSLMRTPIDGARITSGFGMRHHPLLGYTKMHRGVDFGAPVGTPIFASGDGVVARIGSVSGYGNYIKIQHNTNIATAYGHMSRFAPGIHQGSRVRQGMVIGYVGATGRATGPHLHYEVLKANAQVNPLTVVSMAGDMLDGRDLKKFRQNVTSLRVDARKLSVASVNPRIGSGMPTPRTPPSVGGVNGRKQVAQNISKRNQNHDSDD